MIEIKEDDISNVITNVGKSIRCMNKVLECLENIKDKSNIWNVNTEKEYHEAK